MNEFISFYTARSDAIPTPCEDTERFNLFATGEIASMISEGKTKVSPIMIKIFEWYKNRD